MGPGYFLLGQAEKEEVLLADGLRVIAARLDERFLVKQAEGAGDDQGVDFAEQLFTRTGLTGVLLGLVVMLAGGLAMVVAARRFGASRRARRSAGPRGSWGRPSRS